MNLLGAALYDPGTAAAKSTASLIAMTAIDTTNLRLTITVPAHGFIKCKMRCTLTGATAPASILLGVMVASAVKGRVAPVLQESTVAGATLDYTADAEFTMTGLTPGSTVFDAAYAVQVVAASSNIKYGGPNDTSGNDAWGAFVFELWDPQPIPTAAAGASGGLLISGSNAGTTTLGALTVTGTTTMSDGLVVNRSTANSTAVAFTGSGSGNGLTSTGGAAVTTVAGGIGISIVGGAGGTTGAAASGLKIIGGVAGSTSGNAAPAILLTGGAAAAGTGTGAEAINATGGAASTTGAAGVGIKVTGGAGAASGNGAASGIIFTGGGTNTVNTLSHGISVIGTSQGDGLNITCTSGNGIQTKGNGGGHGIYAISLAGTLGGNGIQCEAQTTNGFGVRFLGNGTGSGIRTESQGTGNGIVILGGSTSGAGISITTTSGDGLSITPTAGHGITTTGQGTTKHGINATGSATTGAGMALTGGGTSGDGLLIATTSGHGINCAGGGTTKHGLLLTGGATTSAGLSLVGGGTSGAGILIRTTSGHGVDIAATGTSMHGMTITGGNGGTSDGLKCVAGTGGVDIRGNITGNLVGTVTTVTTVTNQLTAAQIATGVWQDATAGDFTTASSIGKALYIANIAPGGSGGHMISGSNAGTTTLGAFTVTGATTLTGNVVLSDGLTISAPSTLNRAGIDITGNGTGAALKLAAGATGKGIAITTTAGDGISVLPTAGHALVLTGNGTSKHGLISTGGTAGTSDGASFVAGTGGVDLRAAITGNITGNLSGSVGSVTGAVGSVTSGVTVTTNNDKTGYSLTQTFPTNFSSLSIDASGRIDVGKTLGVAVTLDANSVLNVSTKYVSGTLQTARDIGASVLLSVGTGAGQINLSSGNVPITSNRKKGSSTTFEFLMQDATTGAPKTGLTVASVISKDGGAAIATTNAVTEIGLGQYQIVLTGTEATANNIFLQFTATGAITVNISVQMQP